VIVKTMGPSAAADGTIDPAQSDADGADAAPALVPTRARFWRKPLPTQ
jgi:hypothetical protein